MGKKIYTNSHSKLFNEEMQLVFGLIDQITHKSSPGLLVLGVREVRPTNASETIFFFFFFQSSEISGRDGIGTDETSNLGK